jgi:hypothetical protein
MPYVTYHAPPGDSEVVHYMGERFFDGLAVEVTDAHLLSKAANNPHFEVSEDAATSDDAPKRRGRPPKIRPDGEE